MRIRHCFIALITGLAVVAPSLSEAQYVWTPETGRFINMKRLPKETPELQVEYARSLMLQHNAKGALEETGKFDEFYADTDYADDNQFLRGEIHLALGKHKEAAKEFQQVIANYPDSDLFDEVIEKQYEVGDSLFALGEHKAAREGRLQFIRGLFNKRPYKQAIDVYAMVIENQPFTDSAAQAQYKISQCHSAREEYVEAAFEYRRVIEDYPDSTWVDDASFGLAQTYRAASLEAIYDQAPSELAIVATEEFLNRYPGDARGKELSGVRAEMREKIAQQRLVSARFYEKRQMDKSARVYYEVVAEQFSDTQAALEAKDWIDAHPTADLASAVFSRPTY